MKKLTLLVALAATLGFTSCSKDDDKKEFTPTLNSEECKAKWEAFKLTYNHYKANKTNENCYLVETAIWMLEDCLSDADLDQVENHFPTDCE